MAPPKGLYNLFDMVAVLLYGDAPAVAMCGVLTSLEAYTDEY